MDYGLLMDIANWAVCQFQIRAVDCFKQYFPNTLEWIGYSYGW